MGMIHTETLAEYAERTGQIYDTVWRKAKRKIPSVEWTAGSVVTPELYEVLAAGKSDKTKPRSVRIEKKPETIRLPEKPDTPPARQAFRLPSFGLSDFLIVAVYGHTLLVWYEIGTLFALPGILAGLIVFAMKHAALMICRTERLSSLAGDAIGVAFVLDALALYVHYTVFSDSLPPRLAQQMGATGAFWCALVLGGVVATGAFTALCFVKNLTTNKALLQ
jgi:hypothetical protein